MWSTGVGPSPLVRSLQLPKSPGGRYYLPFFSLYCFVLVEYWVQFVKMGVNRVLHEKETENRIKARRMVESMEKKSKQNTSFIVVILLHEQLSSWLQHLIQS